MPSLILEGGTFRPIFSAGVMDALLDNDIEFLYMNIHCHHGMYPLYQNQKPYYWQNKQPGN